MDSTINNIAAVSVDAYQQLSNQSYSTPPNSDSVTENSIKGDTVQVRAAVSLRNLDVVRTIGQKQAELNQLAQGVRETNEAIGSTIQQIKKMSGELQEVLKNFPPFSIDSSERQEILMSYTSLRKEVVRLMVPPPPPPVYEKVKHMWDSLFDQQGNILPSAVPHLEGDSSDTQLKDASQHLDQTSIQLSEFSSKAALTLVRS